MAVYDSNQASLLFGSYHALVECPDGETYVQPYDDIYDLINLSNSLGPGYSIADIF